MGINLTLHSLGVPSSNVRVMFKIKVLKLLRVCVTAVCSDACTSLVTPNPTLDHHDVIASLRVCVRLAAYEAQRKEREAQREDAVKMRQRQAQQDKARKQRELVDDAAAAKAKKSATSAGADHVKERHERAQQEKERRLQQFSELAKTSSQAYQAGARARRNAAMLNCGRCKSVENDAMCRFFHSSYFFCFVLTAILSN